MEGNLEGLTDDAFFRVSNTRYVCFNINYA